MALQPLAALSPRCSLAANVPFCRQALLRASLADGYRGGVMPSNCCNRFKASMALRVW
jgi:hypothetical protein